MAGKKISQLTALGGSFAAGDLFEISKDDGGGSYSSKKITGTEMITSIGAGTVTSVGVSGGVTGLTTSGGPITTSGTMTMAGTLVIANGGTGTTTRQSAIDALSDSAGSTIGHILTVDGSNNAVFAAPAGGSAWTTSGSDIYYNTGMVGIGLTSGFTATLHVKGAGVAFTDVPFLITDSNDIQLMKLTADGKNVLIGHKAGNAVNAAGVDNVLLGYKAGEAITTGSTNVLIGKSTKAKTNSLKNIIIGDQAGSLNLGTANIHLGYLAGWYNNGGDYNISLGYESAVNLTSGDYNICLGHSSGGVTTTGSRNIMIGKNIDASAAGVDDELNIGGNIIGSMAAADRYTKFVGQAYSPTSTLTSSVAITPDFTNGNTFKLTLAHNTALANPTNPKDGATYTIIVTQDGTGSRTMSFGANYKWSGGSAPTLSTAGGAVDILTFISDGTNMYGTSTLNFS